MPRSIYKTKPKGTSQVEFIVTDDELSGFWNSTVWTFAERVRLERLLTGWRITLYFAADD